MDTDDWGDYNSSTVLCTGELKTERKNKKDYSIVSLLYFGQCLGKILSSLSSMLFINYEIAKSNFCLLQMKNKIMKMLRNATIIVHIVETK